MFLAFDFFAVELDAVDPDSCPDNSIGSFVPRCLVVSDGPDCCVHGHEVVVFVVPEMLVANADHEEVHVHH